MDRYHARVMIASLLFVIVGCENNGGYNSDTGNGQSPNIIVILTDDQGYADVGFNEGGEDMRTPNIDRIAENGVVFSQGYVSYPVCGPSRAGLLTGRYQSRFGFGRNPILAPDDPGMGLPLEERTIASALDEVGYHNMVIGKWHMGAHERFHPLNRGFDEFFGFLSGGHGYFPDEYNLQDLSEIEQQWDGYRTKLLRNRERVEETEYLTDALSREAVSFVARNSNRPFFLYLAYNAPHTPMQATQKYLDRFPHIEEERRKTYAAMVSAVDDGVGAVLDKLEELNIEEETLVFFLSDNGGPEHKNDSDNGRLRDGKGSVFEGGVRVPFAIQWPGHLPRGATYNKAVSSLDIFATAAALAGAPINPDKPLDGVNLIPYLTGQKRGAPHEYLFWRKFDQNKFIVREGDSGIKYIVNDGTPMLYNLETDISEQQNIVRQHEDHVRELEKLRQVWQTELMDPVFMGLIQRDEYWEGKK